MKSFSVNNFFDEILSISDLLSVKISIGNTLLEFPNIRSEYNDAMYIAASIASDIPIVSAVNELLATRFSLLDCQLTRLLFPFSPTKNIR